MQQPAAEAARLDPELLTGVGIYAVFKKFRNGFEWVGLRQSNDIDRVPIIADP